MSAVRLGRSTPPAYCVPPLPWLAGPYQRANINPGTKSTHSVAYMHLVGRRVPDMLFAAMVVTMAAGGRAPTTDGDKPYFSEVRSCSVLLQCAACQ